VKFKLPLSELINALKVIIDFANHFRSAEITSLLTFPIAIATFTESRAIYIAVSKIVLIKVFLFTFIICVGSLAVRLAFNYKRPSVI